METDQLDQLDQLLTELARKCSLSSNHGESAPSEAQATGAATPFSSLSFPEGSIMDCGHLLHQHIGGGAKQPQKPSQSVKLTKAFEKLASVLPQLKVEKWKRMDGICKEVFRILQHSSQFQVQRYVLSKFEPKCVMVIEPPPKSTFPSLGPSTSGAVTLSQILNDFELCLKSFLASEQSSVASVDQNNNSQWQMQLFCLTKTNRFTLQFICNGIQLEVIPALNFVRDVLSRAMRDEFLQEQRQGVLSMLKEYPAADDSPDLDERRQLLENSLLEIHFDALSQQSGFIQNVLHIVKLWESVSIWLDRGTNPLPLANEELMDIVAINAAQREEEMYLPSVTSDESLEAMGGAVGGATALKEVKEQPSYLRAFRKFLVSIQLFPNLRINMNKNHTLVTANDPLEEGAEHIVQQLPHVIGFSNPCKNLGSVTESYLMSKFAHAAVTLGFSYGDFDDTPNELQNQMHLKNMDYDQLLSSPGGPAARPNTDGLELFCVIVPYILINEVPDYITALDKLTLELAQAGIGPPDLKLADFYDLTSYVRQAIESGKFKLPEGSTVPTSLEQTFKLFNLCDPPSDLPGLLAGFQRSDYARHITEAEELFNQLVLYEYIQNMEPFPKVGHISVETNESLTWMKFGDCKNFGFNIRSVVFEDNPVAFQFLHTMAMNVELMVLSFSTGEMARGKSLDPGSMCTFLEKHVLTFLNASSGLISMVAWTQEEADEAASSPSDGQDGQDPKKQSDSDDTDKMEHKNYDVTYIVPYTIYVEDEPAQGGRGADTMPMGDEEWKGVPTAVNYAVISLNW